MSNTYTICAYYGGFDPRLAITREFPDIPDIEEVGDNLAGILGSTLLLNKDDQSYLLTLTSISLRYGNRMISNIEEEFQKEGLELSEFIDVVKICSAH